MSQPAKPKPGQQTGEPEAPGGLAHYEVIVAVCGGISAYKTASLVSGLVQRGAGVTTVMTAAAQKFITPLTFESLTARRVHTDLWEPGSAHDPQHLNLTEAADALVIAPATANIISKIAHGLADDLLSTMVLSAQCPILLAPAMNTRMWQNKFVQQNVRTLSSHGYHIIQPGEGWLACRTIGEGRMAPPEVILEDIARVLKQGAPQRSKDKM